MWWLQNNVKQSAERCLASGQVLHDGPWNRSNSWYKRVRGGTVVAMNAALSNYEVSSTLFVTHVLCQVLRPKNMQREHNSNIMMWSDHTTVQWVAGYPGGTYLGGSMGSTQVPLPGGCAPRPTEINQKHLNFLRPKNMQREHNSNITMWSDHTTVQWVAGDPGGTYLG